MFAEATNYVQQMYDSFGIREVLFFKVTDFVCFALFKYLRKNKLNYKYL